MRSDIFVNKKSIHFCLDKEVHRALRTRLFRHNITMQELFSACATLVATETAKGQSIVDFIINKKIKNVLSNSPANNNLGKTTIKKEPLNDLDSEALYNMINGLDEI